jgi:hypothetical protein
MAEVWGICLLLAPAGPKPNIALGLTTFLLFWEGGGSVFIEVSRLPNLKVDVWFSLTPFWSQSKESEGELGNYC